MGLKDSGVAYPRRDDAVRYVRFDGTLEATQQIANLTMQTVTINITPGRYLFPVPGDIMQVGGCSVAGQEVNNGDYVVVDLAGAVKIWSPDAYVLAYSKDGN